MYTDLDTPALTGVQHRKLTSPMMGGPFPGTQQMGGMPAGSGGQVPAGANPVQMGTQALGQAANMMVGEEVKLLAYHYEEYTET